MAKVIIELDVEGTEEDAAYVVGEILDSGVLQDSINDHEYDAGGLRVKSAVCRPQLRLQAIRESNMAAKEAMTVLSEETKALVDDIWKDLRDPDMFESWLAKEGIHHEIFVYTGDEPWHEIADAGASLHAAAIGSKRRLFRTSGEDDSVIFFIAKSEKQIVERLTHFRDRELPVIEVMTS